MWKVCRVQFLFYVGYLDPMIFRVLTDNVNLIAMNLTNQVCSIAQVTKAVAGLTKKKVDVRGEILELKETVNGMTECLSVFADEVTRVAREVGTEGQLGGQAFLNLSRLARDILAIPSEFDFYYLPTSS
jgi:hypothetical protein